MSKLLLSSIFSLAFGAQTLLYADAGDAGSSLMSVYKQLIPVESKKTSDDKDGKMDVKPADGKPVQFKASQPSDAAASDIILKINGRVREDFFYFDKTALFRGDLDDTYRYFRSKVELRAAGIAGLKTYGEPAATFGLQFSQYCYWQRNTTYENIIKRQTFSEGLDRAATGDNHTHDMIVPPVFMEAGAVELHIGAISQFLKKAGHALNLRAGYFPYQLGRGLSLGTHEDMCLTWGGWIGDGENFRFPSMPPGVLLQHKISKTCSWEFYYNKWRAYSDSPFTQNIAGVDSGIFINRLDGRRPARGHDQDRDTWVLRFDFSKEHQKYGRLELQPYFSYTRAPDLTVEVFSDSKAKLGTVGFMADYRYKGWQGNIEVAGQFGHQRMHCIDRNKIELKRDAASGVVREVYSHIFSPSAGADSVYPDGTFPEKVPVRALVSDPAQNLIDIANLSANRPNGTATSSKGCKIPCLSREDILAKNGKQLVDSNGVPVTVSFGVVTPGTARKVYNSNFFGNARFRPSYKLKYQGVMALADLAYTTEDNQFKVAGAVGYIGGDNFPYNNEVDQSFKAFVAQRAAYSGLHVTPLFMFERLVLLRPLNVDYRQMLGRNHFRDYSNLQFFGASFSWFPLNKNRNQLLVMPNVMAFWQVAHVPKWDKTGAHPDAAIERQIELVRTQKLKFCGWESECRASRFLGVEANVIVDYYVLPQCKLYFRGYLFFPGQCYKDLEGMPNEAAVREGKNRELTGFSQLHDVASGFYTGIDFKF